MDKFYTLFHGNKTNTQYGTKVENFKPAINYTFENPIGAAASISTVQFLLVLTYAALAIVITL